VPVPADKITAAAPNLRSRAIVDPPEEAARILGAQGTRVAVSVDASERIASDLFCGHRRRAIAGGRCILRVCPMSDWLDRLARSIARRHSPARRAGSPGTGEHHGERIDLFARALAEPIPRRRMLALTAGVIAGTATLQMLVRAAQGEYDLCPDGVWLWTGSGETPAQVCAEPNPACTSPCGLVTVGDYWAFNCCRGQDICCPFGPGETGSTTYGGLCCTAGEVCLHNPTDCCSAERVCGSQCCPARTRCIAGKCCPPGSTPCGEDCCDASTECRNGQCEPRCPPRQQPCGKRCCPPGGKCVTGKCCKKQRRTLSASGLEFVESEEGFCPKAYEDKVCNCTIGFGHLLHMGFCTKADYRLKWTENEAEDRLRERLSEFERDVQAFGRRVCLDQCQYDALVDFHYNTSPRSWSSLIAGINDNNLDTIADRILQYDKALNQKTKQWEVLPALTGRRRRESAMFRSCTYQYAHGRAKCPRVCASRRKKRAGIGRGRNLRAV
jgi:lysozyme